MASQLRALALIAPLALGACGATAVAPPGGEIDNPMRFRVVALIDGTSRYERFDAALVCTRKVYCDPPGPDCYCERYRLRTDGFALEWSVEAFTGAHLSTSAANLIAFDDAGGNAVAEVSITRRTKETYGTAFYKDFAGTFRVQTAAHSYTQGVFYAYGL